MIKKNTLKKINNYLWEIPKQGKMQVPARVYTSEKMLQDILKDKSLEQLVNVACLPSIQKYALAMPDCHEGYGFPIGGVAAFENLISPGGVGFDINCGVRLLKSDLGFDEIKDKLNNLANQIQRNVPTGLGREARIRLDSKTLNNILENGPFQGADAKAVSERAKARGRDQLGTLGSGNHFIEIQRVDEIFDKKFNLAKNQITVMIHSGSRGLGHQVATDYIRAMGGGELAYAPLNSKLGQQYFKAMAAAANFAWANRQEISKIIQQTLKLELIYDIAHNFAQIENGLCVHRKGATRALLGQLVLIPGTMGTASYVCLAAEKAKESFYSVCHGAGRTMSRTAAKRQIRGSELKQDLEKQGIIIRANSNAGLAEEAPMAYKDIHEVVDVIEKAGLAKKTIKLVPLAVIKGE